MNKRIAIQGCERRGDDVLQALKDMGGKLTDIYSGRRPDRFYYIDEAGYVCCAKAENVPKNYTRLTIEEYLDIIAQAEMHELLILPHDRDTKEVVIPDDCELVNKDGKWVLRRKQNVLWLARDKDGRLFAFSSEPSLNEAQDTWLACNGCFSYDGLFPEITFENSPKKVKLTLL